MKSFESSEIYNTLHD